MRRHRLDGAEVSFDRRTGLNVLRRGPSTAALRREAPRTLQVGLLTPCNLSCDFCYRDPHAPSRWTRESLVSLLREAAAWGVLEVTFGGGEPLLFKGFVDALRELRDTTPLGLHFTTNGTLLTDDVLRALSGVVGEIRVSAYDDNDWRQTVRRASRSHQVGLNLLVTPKNLPVLEVQICEALSLGVSNVLLLGYKGADPSLHLNPTEFARLRATLRRLEGLPLKLDVCWHPRLGDVAQLFAKSDCGAGDEFLALTADRQVQACSFSGLRTPFETIDDLKALWRKLRALKPPANVEGCTRAEFAPQPPAPSELERAWTWTAFASNNSGDWTMAARFTDEATARQVADSLSELGRAHDAFLASDAGEAFMVAHAWDGTVPTPPLLQFAEAHGFTWRGESFSWEEVGAGAPVLTSGALRDCVLVFHPYCSGMPVGPLEAFFERTGAHQVQEWHAAPPALTITATGRRPAVEATLETFFAELAASAEPWSLAERTPWGATAPVPSDEDRSAQLRGGPSTLTRTSDGLVLTLRFVNSYAGALAACTWLRERGYSDVHAELPAFDPITPNPAPVPAKTRLFGDMRPLEQRLSELSTLDLVRTWLEGPGGHPAFAAPLARLPDATLSENLRLATRERWARGRPLGHRLASLAREVSGRVALAELLDEAWPHEPARQVLLHVAAQFGDRTATFTRVNEWLIEVATDARAFEERFVQTGPLHDERLLDALEASGVTPSLSNAWRQVMLLHGLTWARAERWLARGHPWQALALYTLDHYRKSLPADWVRPTRAQLLAAIPTTLERGKREAAALRAQPLALAKP